MPKYLIEASYTAEGAKGLLKGGGTARRAEVQKMVESLGGRLDAFYFVFGENDVHIVLDLPENLTAAAGGDVNRRGPDEDDGTPHA